MILVNVNLYKLLSWDINFKFIYVQIYLWKIDYFDYFLVVVEKFN